MADAPDSVRVLGVLAGSDMPSEQLRRWAQSAKVVLAADGGADLLHDLGVVPDVALGDLDSISAVVAESQKRLIHDEDQDTTDCDKLLAFAGLQGYRAITLAGVEGDLLDHVIGTVLSSAKAPLEVRLALRRGVGFFIKGPSARTFCAQAGGRLSVIPLEPCHGVSISGTKWTLQDARLEPFGLNSLSNVAAEETVQFKIDSGRVLVFVETDGSPTWSDG